jgi:hypothetical protein
VGTLTPVAEYSFTTRFTIGGTGQISIVSFANYTSSSLPAPGFTTQAVTLGRPTALLRASMTPPTGAVSAGSAVTVDGEIRNDGTNAANLGLTSIVLPAGWSLNPAQITVSGTAYSATCTTAAGVTTCTANLGGLSVNPGTARPIRIRVQVPAGTTTGLYPLDLQVWASSTGYGGSYETYFPDIVRLPINQPRSTPPTLDCPILSSATRIGGSTVEADGTTIRLYFNLIERGRGTSAAGRFEIGTFGPGTDFGQLYGGLEVTATAQAPGELESEPSTPCYVSHVPGCSDGFDNDGDGLIDFPLDPGCAGPTDNDERDPQCSDGLDNDGDGRVDFPNDPGCHSSNDDNEADFVYAPDDVRARLLLVFDTSGSMNWNVCNDTFTGGDGSVECLGSDVPCTTCSASGCGNGRADDSRIHRARTGVANVVAGYGDVEFALMRYRQRAVAFACPGLNATAGSGGWAGAGAVCGSFAAGDLLVGFSPENEYDLLEWIDGRANYAGTPPPGFDIELRGSGTTPIAGSLNSARAYLETVRGRDGRGACRPYRVILLTDGTETCGGDPVAAASALRSAGFPVHVIGFAIDAGSRAQLDAIAAAGGTGSAIFVDDSAALSAAIARIVNESTLIETCNGLDDDCDTLVDEGFVLYCNRPAGVTSLRLCTDPGETVCDGVDDNCNGRVDEGLRNRCGNCGAEPPEVCNRIDDDCDGAIDEGGVCSGCVPSPEVCDNLDNDCDTRIDEGVTRPCGTDLGECTVGVQTCVAGEFGACSGVGPSPEVCDNLDNDCDGVVDGLTRPCGSSVGACIPGTQTCTAGSFGTCIGAIGPTAERCNAIDDDCDGRTDEGNPGGGVACGDATGECEPGITSCVGGRLVCEGGRGPVEELCNMLDDDCDGVVDDGLSVGAPCGTDVGECVPGTLVCRDGMIVCEGGLGPLPEACNALDDDCDGAVDEMLPLGAECGMSEGACRPGRIECVGGRELCVGEAPRNREACDCEDNDCDGTVDEAPETGALCPPGSECVECSCALPCTDSEFAPCPEGRVRYERDDGRCYCVAPRCDLEACSAETVRDAEGHIVCAPSMSDVPACTCVNNRCTFPCDGVLCTEPLVCHPDLGTCVTNDCLGLGCPAGQFCDPMTRECVDDPCASASCAPEQACRSGTCETSCGDVICERGQRCARGECVDDLCFMRSCRTDEVCDPATGDCVMDRCRGVLCGRGSVCDPSTGDCRRDPCVDLRCPAGQYCRRGECARTSMVGDAGPLSDGGEPPDGGDPSRRVLAAGGGGCHCGIGGGARGPRGLLFFALLGIVLMRRRRGAPVAEVRDERAELGPAGAGGAPCVRRGVLGRPLLPRVSRCRVARCRARRIRRWERATRGWGADAARCR